MRIACLVVLLGAAAACAGQSGAPSSPAAESTAQAPADAQHKGITGPHGDHTPRHGGMVLMNGDIHYEVVLDRNGRHQVWFSDAMRNELPASIASGVTMEVARPGAAVESVPLTIDDAGEAWIGNARPISGEGVMVKLRYSLQGQPYEIEIPFVESAPRD